MITQTPAGTQSLRRAIATLRVLSVHDEKGLRLSQVARMVDLHISTVRRILLILCVEELAFRNPATKRYHIGPGTYALTYKPQYSAIRATYRGAIEKIALETGDTVHLTVRSGNETLCIDRCEGPGAVRIVYELGRRTSLGLGAGGMAILSVLDDHESESILDANQKSYLANDMTVTQVRSLVALARQLGYAVNQGHTQKGITGLAIPIYDNLKIPMGAIAVASISERMDAGRQRKIVKICKSAIADIRQHQAGQKQRETDNSFKR
jgi:DNA-binding IclR family transcriptional regulator